MEKDMNNPGVLAERTRLVRLWLAGVPVKYISAESGASLSTVYRWIRRWRECGSLETRPYRTMPRRLGPRRAIPALYPPAIAGINVSHALQLWGPSLEPDPFLHDAIFSSLCSFRYEDIAKYTNRNMML